MLPMQLVKDRKALTLAAAKGIADAAQQFAASQNLSVVIAVLDHGANLLCLSRMDDAPIGSVTVAQDKARTAVIFKCATKDVEGWLNGGMTSLLKLDMLPFEGGVPLKVGDDIVGAIGVSGGSAPQDGSVANAGAQWLADSLKR